MKIRHLTHLFPLLIVFLFTGLPYLHAQVYVKHDATGANTGASWTDAYTNLKTALNDAPAGAEVWVAAGTYKPALPNGDQNNSFLVSKSLSLLGGFAGTETAAEQRDPETNVVILSGDLNGDDTDDDFDNNRSDNSKNVVRVQNVTTGPVVIDGFIITNGNAATFGGGVYSLKDVHLKRCLLKQNHAGTSGGAYYANQPTSAGTRIENCRFERNRSEDWTGGSGIYVRGVQGDGVEVTGCVFEGNTGGRGSAISSFNGNLNVRLCSFLNNINQEQGGALWFFCSNNTGSTLDVDSCHFEGNQSSFGGALYFLVLNAAASSSARITRSTFTNNRVIPNLPGWDQAAGAIGLTFAELSSNTEVLIQDCVFTGNSSSQAGGAIEHYGDATATTINISRCQFIENQALGTAGVKLDSDWNSVDSRFTVDSCLFISNTSTFGASGLRCYLAGQNPNIRLSSSDFWANMATEGLSTAEIYSGYCEGGHALVEKCNFSGNQGYYDSGLTLGSWTQIAGNVLLEARDCEFTSNYSETVGSALTLWSTEDGTAFKVDNCILNGNTAGTEGGGIVVVASSPNMDVAVNNCDIRNNQSPLGSGVLVAPILLTDPVLTEEADIRLNNCLLTENKSANGTVAVRHTGQVELINCTVANNESDGIFLDTSGYLTLQNTILYNPGFQEFRTPGPDATFLSAGGNLVYDLSLNGQLQVTDKQDLYPGFAAPGDYRLGSGSPCIDMGVDPGNLPATDLDGNLRVYGAAVDMGAYEYNSVSGAHELAFLPLQVSPNPAVDFLRTGLSGDSRVLVFDAQGRLLFRQVLPAGEAVDVRALAPGVYFLRAMVGGVGYTGRFVKG